MDKCRVANWNFQKVISPFTRIYLIHDGEGVLQFNQRRIILRPGYMYLVPSFTMCNYSSHTILDHSYIHFVPVIPGGNDLFRILDFYDEREAGESDLKGMQRILELNPGKKLLNTDPARYCREELIPGTEDPVSPQKIAGCMETQGVLLQILSRFICDSEKEKNEKEVNPESRIREITEYIHTHLSGPLSVSELARISHLTDDYFSRLFMKTMGIRPLEYINRKRIEEAQMLLVTTNDPVEKIALETGIDNFSWFCRLFKKYTCSTPGEYRRLHRLI